MEKTHISMERKNLEKEKTLGNNDGNSKGLFPNISEATLLKFILTLESRLI